MSKIFEQVAIRTPRMSAFDQSHEKKGSGTIGNLIPVLSKAILPGDQVKLSTELFMRFAPLIAPNMHRWNAYVHYFFVPNRIIWDEWEDFITGGRDGVSAPTVPLISMSATNFAEGKLADYLGFPTVTSGPSYQPSVSSLPFRAYQKIYNEYYRDETLSPEIPMTATANEISQIRQRSYEKDYFTSALNDTQRGPQVTLDGNIIYKDPSEVRAGANPAPPNENLGTNASGDLEVTTSNLGVFIDNIDSLGITIEELRQSSALQRFLERNMRGGYRYTEQILSHFGVRSSDARLQRPEYLGGNRQPIVISEVLNTSATATEPQGTMAGHGLTVGSSRPIKRRFEEHGFLMAIMSVIPRTAYQQGIPREHLRFDRLDYYWPEFANLGEQEVQNQEIYYDQTTNADLNRAAFGYQQKYAEYKYEPSTVHGDFRSSLDYWHSGRIFAGPPSLNQGFVEVAAGAHNRMFAVTAGDHLWYQLFHNLKIRRPMPYFGVPSLR